MIIQTTRGLIAAFECILLCVLQIPSASAEGSLQVSLHYYIFSYENTDTAVTPSQANNVTIAADYVKTYKPQWNLSRAAGLNSRQAGDSNHTHSNISIKAWPWEGSSECSETTQYRFLICLDYDKSYDPERPCALHRIQTQLIPIDRTSRPPSELGGESITFSNYLLGAGQNQGVISNPLHFEFTDWKGPVRISVHINCCAENQQYKGQCNEEVSTTFSFSPRTFLEGTYTIQRRLSGRGSVIMSISSTCNPFYFRPSCDLFCKVDNAAAEHTFCNTSSGQKQCLAGWSGADCQKDVNECRDTLCQNGGTCQNSRGSFLCSCRMGTRGRFCEQRTPLCHLQPCQNQGSCLDTPEGTHCLCLPGFTGQRCQEEIKQKFDQTTPWVTTYKSTTGAGLLTSAPTAFVIDNIERSKVKEYKEEGRWHHWYLAVIIGGLFLVVTVAITVIIRQIKIRNDYKVALSLSSPGNTFASRSTQDDSNSFNNTLYQVDDTISIIISSTNTGTNIDNLHAYFHQDHTGVHNGIDDNGHYSSPKSDQVDVEGAYAISWTANKHPALFSYDGFGATMLAGSREVNDESGFVVDERHWLHQDHLTKTNETYTNNLGGTEMMKKCNLSSKTDNGNNEHEYEEIDFQRRTLKNDKSTPDQKTIFSVNSEYLERSDVWRGEARLGGNNINNTNCLYPEDDHGYLTPRVQLVPSQNFHESVVHNEYTSLSGIYDYPHSSEGIIVTIQSQNNDTEPTQDLHMTQVCKQDTSAKTYISKSEDDAVLPDCESLKMSPVIGSVEIEENTDPIYANSEIFYAHINNMEFMFAE